MRKFMIVIPLALGSLIACGSPSESPSGTVEGPTAAPMMTAGVAFRTSAVNAETSVSKMVAAHQVITPDALSQLTSQLIAAEQAWANETLPKNWALLTPAEQSSEMAAAGDGEKAAIQFGNLLKQMMPDEMTAATSDTTANDTGDDDDDDDTCPAQLRNTCRAACAAAYAAAVAGCSNFESGSAAAIACQAAAAAASVGCIALCNSKCPAF